MRNIAPKIMLALLLILAVVAVLLSFRLIPCPIPMTGYITEKTYHPAYYPADDRTPWVYCIVIQDEAASRCISWQVTKAAYDRYTVGQHVQKGWW